MTYTQHVLLAWPDEVRAHMQGEDVGEAIIPKPVKPRIIKSRKGQKKGGKHLTPAMRQTIAHSDRRVAEVAAEFGVTTATVYIYRKKAREGRLK